MNIQLCQISLLFRLDDNFMSKIFFWLSRKFSWKIKFVRAKEDEFGDQGQSLTWGKFNKILRIVNITIFAWKSDNKLSVWARSEQSYLIAITQVKMAFTSRIFIEVNSFYSNMFLNSPSQCLTDFFTPMVS